MKLMLNMIELKSFKGISHKIVKLNRDVTKIVGQNGSGKTTIGMSFAWVMGDADLELNKNPNVIPLGDTECRPYVKLWLELDGKELTVSREQIVKVKNVDGKVKTDISNVYTINDVEKGLREFSADLKGRGIDMDRFLLFSNPNTFMNDTSKKGREEMRKVLFEMTEDVSDKELAEELKLKELSTLLENYTLEEITAKNKNTIKKIKDANGANNELIDARISGIIQSKSKLDPEELGKVREEYEKELADIQAKAGLLLDSDSKAKAEIAQLEGELIEIERAERRKIDDKIDKKVHALMAAQSEANAKKSDMIATKGAMDHTYAQIDGVKESLENYRSLYKKVQDEVFDESSTVCPTCGRSYNKADVDEMRAKFEKSKTERLADYKKKGETYSKQLKKLEKEYEENKSAYEQAEKDWKAADKKVDKLDEENNAISRVPDLTKVKDYIDTENRIKELRAVLQAKGDLELQKLSSRESYLKQMIRQVDGEFAVVERNKELDEQIKRLRDERKQGEINKANAERVLSHVEQLERAKNERLTSQINSHFSTVSWRLFKTLKNGTIEQDVTPLVNGKELSSSCNGSLITAAKISICNDLGKYFNQRLPIICDDFSLFSSNTMEMLDTEGTQFIGLMVSEDKELKIENG